MSKRTSQTMAARILKMSDADTVKFVKLYQNEPGLWDPSREDYKKRERRAAAARRIADAMQIEGFTDMHVIMKFKNLRSSYSQELKKISQSVTSDEIYVPKVTWFKTMDSFLKPHVMERKNQSNWEDRYTNYLGPISGNRETLKPEDNVEVSYEENKEKPRTPKEGECQNGPALGKRKWQHATTPMLSQLKKTSLNSANVSLEDSFDHFGRYVASLLRSLPQERSTQLQPEIISMILIPNNYLKREKN